MAIDWLKVEKTTPRKPEVLHIAARLGVHPDHAFGLCFRFWAWCDDNLTKANADGVSIALADNIVDRAGFAEAMVSSGWLIDNGSSFTVSHFDKHLSKSSKTRALTAKRVAVSASKHKRNTNGASVSKPYEKALTELDSLESNDSGIGDATSSLGKRLSIRDIPVPDSLQNQLFLNAWRDWIKHRREIKKPLTPTQAQKQLNQFASWGETRAISAIEHTIKKGWQGIAEPSEGLFGKQNQDAAPSYPTDEELENNWSPITGVSHLEKYKQ